MDESYGTYVDDEYFDNHDYADDTDDDIDDDTDDVVGPWSMYNSGGLRVHSVGDSSPQWRMGWDGLGWGGMGWMDGWMDVAPPALPKNLIPATRRVGTYPYTRFSPKN